VNKPSFARIPRENPHELCFDLDDAVVLLSIVTDWLSEHGRDAGRDAGLVAH